MRALLAFASRLSVERSTKNQIEVRYDRLNAMLLNELLSAVGHGKGHICNQRGELQKLLQRRRGEL